MRTAVIFAVTLLLTLSSAPFGADPPELVNYQGVLRDASDKPLTGLHNMRFRLYDAPTGGNEILRDEHLAAGTGAVGVTGGLFSVQIGSGQVIDGAGPGTFQALSQVFRTFSEVHLEVEVEGEFLVPRTRIASAPYSLNPVPSSTSLVYSKNGVGTLSGVGDSVVIPSGTFASQDRIEIILMSTCSACVNMTGCDCVAQLELSAGPTCNITRPLSASGQNPGLIVFEAKVAEIDTPDESLAMMWLEGGGRASGTPQNLQFVTTFNNSCPLDWITGSFSLAFTLSGGQVGVPSYQWWIYRVRG